MAWRVCGQPNGRDESGVIRIVGDDVEAIRLDVPGQLPGDM